MNLFISGAVTAAVIVTVVVVAIKKRLYQSAVQALQEGSWDSYEKRLDTGLYRFFFSRKALLEMKFNGALVFGKSDEVQTLLAHLQKLRVSAAASQKLSMKAFNYFTGLNKGKLAKKYLDQVLAGPNEQMKQEAGRVYRIFIEKSDADLPALLEEMEQLPEQARGVHAYLISAILQNAGKAAEAEPYLAVCRESFPAYANS